ncbi:hypothetical protein R1sor_008138 [Riccia sorocarpa]|uniref:Uncharacterized protein n=1 Tax=Riccia sorocarpa TaxID=122646 RepID=A0ABD3HSH1_9MARC
MTRPPRLKYPSDAKNYHDTAQFAHTIRLPEELLQPYLNLKIALGSRTTHADVIRFLFEAADVAIQTVLQSAEVCVVSDSQEHLPMEDPAEADPDNNSGDVAADSEDLDPKVLDEASRMLAVPDRFDPVVIQDSQIQQDLEPSRVTFEASNAFWAKSKDHSFYTWNVASTVPEVGSMVHCQ